MSELVFVDTSSKPFLDPVGFFEQNPEVMCGTIAKTSDSWNLEPVKSMLMAGGAATLLKKF